MSQEIREVMQSTPYGVLGAAIGSSLVHAFWGAAGPILLQVVGGILTAVLSTIAVHYVKARLGRVRSDDAK